MDQENTYNQAEDIEELEYQKRRQARMERRRREKERQLRRRKMMRLVSMAVVLVCIIALAGTGIVKLASKLGKNKPEKMTEEVKAEVSEGEIQAEKQPVMSAGDIAKLTDQTTVIGWQNDENGKWYRNVDGTFFEAGWKEIDGAKYYFNENGYVATGWLELDGKDYYFDEEGKYDSTKVRPMVALTFDDGPGKYTAELLDCLEANNAKATFYMLGENAKQYPELIQRMKESGMGIGNHSYNHKILSSISAEQVKSQIEDTNDAIAMAIGAPADTMRPPGGSYNKTVQETVGMPIVKWSIDTRDWATRSEDKTYQVTVDNVQDGSIVLMHDIHEWSVKASIRAIPELIAKGFKLVTVEELAAAKGIEMEDGQVYEYFGEGTQQVE